MSSKVISEGHGMLVVVRRPTEENSANAFLPHHICCRLFLRKRLACHVKTCRLGKGNQSSTDSTKNGTLLLVPFAQRGTTDVRLEKVLSGLRETSANEGQLKPLT